MYFVELSNILKQKGKSDSYYYIMEEVEFLVAFLIWPDIMLVFSLSHNQLLFFFDF